MTPPVRKATQVSRAAQDRAREHVHRFVCLCVHVCACVCPHVTVSTCTLERGSRVALSGGK